MNADSRRIQANGISSHVIECAFRVSNALGAGFLEKVYENALAVEFRGSGLEFKQQPLYRVRYLGEIVGEYIPDFVVADTVIVEIKAQAALDRVHQAQCMNYLRATNLSVGLLLNFGTPRVEIKRLVWRF
jgi:GxxExxY protein